MKRSPKEIQRAFRDCLAKLGMLRSAVPDAPVLALTATADKPTQKKLLIPIFKERLQIHSA